MTSHPVWDHERDAPHLACGSALRIYLDHGLGLLSVEHTGSIGWDELQAIKNAYFGQEACAIEVYPPSSQLVNNVPMRHLWLLGPDDWWPDLGREGSIEPLTLRVRYGREAS